MALKGDLLRKCSDDRSGRYRPRCQSYHLTVVFINLRRAYKRNLPRDKGELR